MIPALSPAEVELARRAIAAGAPEVDDNTVIVVPGVSFRSIPTGLVYDRATRLPLLSDRSWIGWTLDEAERRGWCCSWMTAGNPLWYRVIVRSAGADRPAVSEMHPNRPAALVAVLEATR